MHPLGMRFCPKNEDIILHFLCGKHRDKSFPLDPIIECEIYGENARSWRRVFEESGQKYHYFFTTLTKKTSHGKRVERRTAGGTWKTQKDEKIFTTTGDHQQRRHIGSVRRFTFLPKDGSTEQQRWVMMEFRIDGEVLRQIKNEDYVICLIKKKKEKKIDEAPLWISPEPNYYVNKEDSTKAMQMNYSNDMSWKQNDDSSNAMQIAQHINNMSHKQNEYSSNETQILQRINNMSWEEILQETSTNL